LDAPKLVLTSHEKTGVQSQLFFLFVLRHWRNLAIITSSLDFLTPNIFFDKHSIAPFRTKPPRQPCHHSKDHHTYGADHRSMSSQELSRRTKEVAELAKKHLTDEGALNHLKLEF